MAVFRFQEKGQPERPAITKAAARRLVRGRDEEIKSLKKHNTDMLMLANRWGAKASEFDKRIQELEFERRVWIGMTMLASVLAFAGLVW